MAEAEKKRPVLLRLAAEGVVPVLGGCAGALAGGPEGGMAGVALGQAVEKGINIFGKGIVERWQGWFARNKAEAAAAVAELAAVPPAEAREQVRSIFLDLSPGATAHDISLAIEFVAAIPRSVDRALVPDAAGGRSVPATVSFDDPRSLLQLLPEDVPPYSPASDLPGTPYQLVELVGSGGFGAVYRAFSPTLQHLPLAIKFCLDRSLLPALNQERSNLERLMRAGGRGSGNVVRLYGYDLDHPTPYLVYEYVPGGDLTKLVAARRAAIGRAPDPAEVLGWVAQIAEGLAFAHRTGLVHRDLKPANVLVALAGDRRQGTGDRKAASPLSPDSCLLSPELRLADFGLGGVGAARAVARSRIGASTVDYLSLADQASLFRGAGTPLYMSPEQRRGAAADPRHDLYALGVVWYQLLIGDVSRELHHGWAKELVVRYGVPPSHIALIERCVGWFDERPKDADEFLGLLAEVGKDPSPGPSPEKGGEQIPEPLAPPSLLGKGAGGFGSADTALNASQVTPVPRPPSGLGEGRRRGLLSGLARLEATYAGLDEMGRWRFNTTLAYGFLLGLLLGWLFGEFVYSESGHGFYSFPMAFRGVWDWGANAAGFGVGLFVWGLYVWLIRSGVRAVAADIRKQADALIKELAADFPAEVADWGGRSVLRHPATVRQLRAELDPPPPAAPPSPTSVLTADEVGADPTRKTILVARLRDVDKALDTAGDAVSLSWMGFFLLCCTAVPVSGVGAHAALYKVSQLDGVGSVLAGVLTGAVVLAVVLWAMAAIRRHFRARLAATLDRFVADYPRLVETWGGRAVLESRETVGALIRTYEPAAGQRVGWFRRLFGG